MSDQKTNTPTMEDIVALCKRRGFVYQGSEIYGGLAGTWDYGPYGVLLKNNLKQLWWRRFVAERDDMYGVDAAILMNARVWEASGHTGAGFADPMVSCKKCKYRFRPDQEIQGFEITMSDAPDSEAYHYNEEFLDTHVCSNCGEKGNFTTPILFNMMFETRAGATAGAEGHVYLRPETAQGMFVNFKNVVDSLHPKLPFGLAQIGKAFRNEIAPRDFIFRTREFEQMEIEYFVRERDWEEQFAYWRVQMLSWMDEIGLPKERIHELDVPESERAHYSKKTIDFEYDFPFGTKELYGLAYRTDFDLKNHMEHSGVDIRYTGQEQNEKFIPHVIEPTFGLDRTVLAVLVSAYTEDELGGEKRVYLALAPHLAPVKVAVFPLLKNKPQLVEKAREVYQMIKKEIPETLWDDNGNIGKRYRRQDEIGTPACVTIDFDTLGDGDDPSLKDTVTVRNRDTGKQERVAIGELTARVSS